MRRSAPSISLSSSRQALLRRINTSATKFAERTRLINDHGAKQTAELVSYEHYRLIEEVAISLRWSEQLSRDSSDLRRRSDTHDLIDTLNHIDDQIRRRDEEAEDVARLLERSEATLISVMSIRGSHYDLEVLGILTTEFQKRFAVNRAMNEHATTKDDIASEGLIDRQDRGMTSMQ